MRMIQVTVISARVASSARGASWAASCEEMLRAFDLRAMHKSIFSRNNGGPGPQST
jgi:hypothetical protein